MVARVRTLVVFGTRPEAIKLAPVIRELARRKSEFEVSVAVTAQHREMLDSVLGLFGIAPDFDLDIMTERQSLTQITLRALEGLSPLVEQVQPHVVLVQGDTTTTFVAALSAFYHKVPVGHVEAGLRTHDLSRPYPEEANRRLTAQITRWHFAPTEAARCNLLAEGVDPGRVLVTGNTVVDALRQTVEMPHVFPPGEVADVLASGRRVVLVTAHRRENWGQPIGEISEAVRRLAEAFPDIEVLFATHRNPIVADAVRSALGGRERVHLIGPQEYLPFVKLLDAATLVLTDSGGIQEEATVLGRPTLVMRDVTERAEAIDAGVATLVGANAERIVAAASAVLAGAGAAAGAGAGRTGAAAGAAAGAGGAGATASPFGDGHASERIADALSGLLGD